MIEHGVVEHETNDGNFEQQANQSKGSVVINSPKSGQNVEPFNMGTAT